VGASRRREDGGDVNAFLNGWRWILSSAHWTGPDGIPTRLWEHLQLSIVSLALACLIAIPIALLVGHTRRGQVVSVQLANLGRSIPSLAILSLTFLVAVKAWPKAAFGFLPTIAALTLLGIPVIFINTYVGIQQVDPDTVEAARGMGMDGRQVLFRLEIPLAMPLIMTGLRLAAVQIVATATLAALIAGGALGRYIVDGFAQQDTPKLVAGAILVALLAVATDASFSLLARAVTPKQASVSRGRQAPRAASAAAGPDVEG
jgi:osmoprotectant transport system permease protein